MISCINVVWSYDDNVIKYQIGIGVQLTLNLMVFIFFNYENKQVLLQ